MSRFSIGDLVVGIDGSHEVYFITNEFATMEVLDIDGISILVEVVGHEVHLEDIGLTDWVDEKYFTHKVDTPTMHRGISGTPVSTGSMEYLPEVEPVRVTTSDLNKALILGII